MEENLKAEIDHILEKLTGISMDINAVEYEFRKLNLERPDIMMAIENLWLSSYEVRKVIEQI